MNLRIHADELPVTVLEAVGFMANHAILRVADVKHDPEARTVTFPLNRFPITGKSIFTGTRHAKTAVRCRVTFRNVVGYKIDQHTKEMETINLIFGFKIKRNEIYLCSAEEDQGVPCFELRCQINFLDIEIKDE
ncbi:MAG: hypothetical protein KJ620_05415 [Candidatus Edwardsbacteria bacterium]|nr:hypothetical protein [Candidatus Edwardsbacteria bacterium]MBU1577560.1 hypothetical protein [Candidatus Edwardsbacteria bacterium]MBU2462502.1 hypothetical protein [Candidatus Edwardsbacteria bacterium]MBU2593655.1 hypothetical protein [Candidatus Edwardsbacteria bacterium]